MLKDIKQIEEKWDSLTEDEKREIFLWKMIWYHHEKHIPGSPSQPIWDLAKVIENASDSSKSLTRSITIATWVGAVATIVGVITAIALHFC
jgi:hypothetical protein